MASDPVEVAKSAYVSYVKERGHAPKRTVHLFNWCKFHQPPFKTKFCIVKDVLSNPPDVSEFVKATNSTSMQVVENSMASRKSTEDLYKLYQKEHEGKHPSTVARFQHFCESKGENRSYAECSVYWVQQQHLHRGAHSISKKLRRRKKANKIRYHDEPSAAAAPQEAQVGEPRVLMLTDECKRARKEALEAAAAQEEKHEEYKVPGVETYLMNESHVKKEVKEHTSDMKLDDGEGGDVSCMKLQEVFDSLEVSEEQLAMWASYGGGRLFNNKGTASSRLKTVLQYVHSNKQCSEHIRHKMAVITKLILDKGAEKSDEYVHILLLLASHGNVCNVMKEVAIGNAYGILTDKMDDFVQQQTLEQQLLKVLRDFRVLKVETLFHAFKMTNNTHYIAGFHNVLAPNIGVTPYNDEHICTPSTTLCKDWRKNLDKRYFAEYYTTEQVVDHVLEQISEKKISYQKVVRFLEDVCPNDVTKMNFLQSAIDIDTGKINRTYVAFMLQKFEILKEKPDGYVPPQVEYEPIQKK